MHHEELALLGRIVAETAHDLNNVLAVTRDAGGLLGDILKVAPSGSLPHGEKLVRIAESIDRQTKRGAEAAKALNQFAHLTDHAVAKMDTATLVPLARMLATRYAAQSRTTVFVGKLVTRQEIECRPLQTLLAIVSCLRACVTSCPGGQVTISTHKAKPGAEVHFRLEQAVDGPPPVAPQPCLQDIGAHFTLNNDTAVLHLVPHAG